MALIYQDLSEPVKKVVEQTLSQRVVSCEELRDGKTHFVYIVVTDGGRYIVKAFRQRTIFSEYDLPDHDKLLWVTDQLDKEGIRHQKILAFQPKHELLPGGFVIFEYVEGENAKKLIEQGDFQESEFFNLLGKYLKEVHAIKIPSYGSIDLKRDSHGNFSEWKMKSSMEGVRKMDDKLQFTEGDYKNMEKVLSELNDIESRFSPVLIHGDPWPINCIMSEQGMVVVDWDEAHASIWLADLANVTYINDPISLDDQRMQEKINSFLAGYGQTNLSYEEIKKGIRSLHLLNAISLIMYHYYHTNNDEELILAKNKILTLL